jgi:hypothetical protein
MMPLSWRAFACVRERVIYGMFVVFEVDELACALTRVTGLNFDGPRLPSRSGSRGGRADGGGGGEVGGSLRGAFKAGRKMTMAEPSIARVRGLLYPRFPSECGGIRLESDVRM